MRLSDQRREVAATSPTSCGTRAIRDLESRRGAGTGWMGESRADTQARPVDRQPVQRCGPDRRGPDGGVPVRGGAAGHLRLPMERVLRLVHRDVQDTYAVGRGRESPCRRWHTYWRSAAAAASFMPSSRRRYGRRSWMRCLSGPSGRVPDRGAVSADRSILIDDDARRGCEAVIDVVRAVRNLRAEFRLPSGESIPATVDAPGLGRVLGGRDFYDLGAGPAIAALARRGGRAGSDDRVSVVLPVGTVTVPLGGLVDVDRERARLRDELGELEGRLAKQSARLANDAFVSKAPEDVVERERERLTRTEERRERVLEILSRLGG